MELKLEEDSNYNKLLKLKKEEIIMEKKFLNTKVEIEKKI